MAWIHNRGAAVAMDPRMTHLKNMEQTIAVLNQKGGVGKTTTACSLASIWAQGGRAVLLVDFDPQGNSTSALGLGSASEGATVYEGLLGKVSLSQLIVPTAWPNLDILPANANLAAAELELAAAEGREQYLKRLLAGQKYDVVVVDCPPALGLLSINGLVAADWLLVPVQAEYLAMEGLGQLLGVVGRVRKSLNADLELLGLVLTMFDGRNSLSLQVRDELRKHFGDKLCGTIIPRNVRLAEAPSHGKPINLYDRWSKGARAYRRLTRELDRKLGWSGRTA